MVHEVVSERNHVAQAFVDSNGASADILSPVFTHVSIGTSREESNHNLAADGEDNVIPLQKVHWEHHGPRSWASACSPPGIRWVCDKVNSEDFGEIANDLTKAWSRRLKLKRPHTVVRKSTELAEPAAWKYATAYFEQSYEAVFGIVHRQNFEARLRSYFEGNECEQEEEDCEFYALRNAIYALGCRSLLATDPTVDFVQAESEASQYFGNALSVFNQLLFGFSGLGAVQAITLMTFYAEGIASPAIEYPLCVNAVQLALAKGLHREPSKSWRLAETDVLSRNWLWWAIYCLEKQIAFRSGRPSMIDDNNVSTKIPHSSPAGSTTDVEIATLMVRHCQISSQISSRVMSIKAFRQPPTDLICTVQNIHDQLMQLLASIPPYLSIEGTSKMKYPSAARKIQSLYLHFALHGSLMAIHTIFFYPWILGPFSGGSDPLLQIQISKSSETVSWAAREIIRVLHSLSIDVATPAWQAFYYPIYAHINLFIHTLKDPHRATAFSDLALLDICAGHFGHLEHVTSSHVAFHFPRDSAAIAAKHMKAVKEKEPNISGGLNASCHTRLGSPTNLFVNDTDYVFTEASGVMMDDPFNTMDLELGGWDIFSSDANDSLDAALKNTME